MSRPFHDPESYEFVSDLERAAPAIRAELEALGPGAFTESPDSLTTRSGGHDETGWRWFPLLGEGSDARGRDRCPRTVEACEAVPGLVNASFSLFRPGTHLFPHRGEMPGVLRCHLPLRVPAGDLGLRAAGETRSWREGECLVFDDSFEHDAWNRGEGDRVVLIVTFRPEEARASEARGTSARVSSKAGEEPPLRLRRAEAVLRRRTSRVVLVLEQPWNDDNVQAVLRTAESFGVQHVWLIQHPHGRRRVQRSVTRGSHDWLTLRTFESSAELVRALRAERLTVWVSDLSPAADRIERAEDLRPVPERLALVVGREVDGVSDVLLAAADRRLFLPMQGFTESFNLSVATALLLQRLFDADPSLVGAMSDEERAALREVWYPRLGGRDVRKRERYRDQIGTPPPPLDDPRPLEENRLPRVKVRGKRHEDAGS